MQLCKFVVNILRVYVSTRTHVCCWLGWFLLSDCFCFRVGGVACLRCVWCVRACVCVHIWSATATSHQKQYVCYYLHAPIISVCVFVCV